MLLVNEVHDTIGEGPGFCTKVEYTIFTQTEREREREREREP